MNINSNEIEFESSAHGAGVKKVFINSLDTATKLTQFAYGKLLAGENVEEHMHPSMEEFFYILKGDGVYVIDHSLVKVSPGVIVQIPAGITHALSTVGSTPL
ncbi:MAG: cupin domain-containing protein, partial [Chitinophagaceae bacterium]